MEVLDVIRYRGGLQKKNRSVLRGGMVFWSPSTIIIDTEDVVYCCCCSGKEEEQKVGVDKIKKRKKK